MTDTCISRLLAGRVRRTRRHCAPNGASIAALPVSPARRFGSRWATAHLPSLDWRDEPCHGRGRESCTNRGPVMRHRAVLVVMASLGIGLATVAPATAHSPAEGPLVQVSGTSAFLGVAPPTGSPTSRERCSSTARWSPGSTSTRRISDNIVGIWQQDRWSNGGARGLVGGVSFDGGTSRQEGCDPRDHAMLGRQPGRYRRLSAGNRIRGSRFGPDGTVHQLALSFNDVAPLFEPKDFDHALLASRSTDGGSDLERPGSGDTWDLDARCVQRQAVDHRGPHRR